MQNGSSNSANGLPVLLTCNTGMCITGSMVLTIRILDHSSIIIISSIRKPEYTYNQGPLQAYFSFARATHEPNQDDYETGLNQQPVPETVNDFELGLNKKTPVSSWGITRLLHVIQKRTRTYR